MPSKKTLILTKVRSATAGGESNGDNHRLMVKENLTTQTLENAKQANIRLASQKDVPDKILTKTYKTKEEAEKQAADLGMNTISFKRLSLLATK